jgi:predicted ATPase
MFGRSLYVPHSYGGIARFAFPELCAQPVGAADYIALCQRYHTVVITDVPQMSMRIRDQVIIQFF